jgi:hypothetical protein
MGGVPVTSQDDCYYPQGLGRNPRLATPYQSEDQPVKLPLDTTELTKSNYIYISI